MYTVLNIFEILNAELTENRCKKYISSKLNAFFMLTIQFLQSLGDLGHNYR